LNQEAEEKEKNVMKRISTASLVVSTLVALLLLVSTGKKSAALLPVVHAQDETSGCSLASLNGRYALSRQGTIVAQIPGFPAPPAPFGEVAIATFDGAGAFSGRATVNIGGLVLNPVNFTATYTVNPDCTGTATVNTGLGLTLHNAIVVIGGGKRFIGTETDLFEVVQTSGQRLGE
jgi:hypothetical protein